MCLCVCVHELSTVANWEASELLVVAKHCPKFGKDKIIGLAVVPCSCLVDQANLTLGLASCTPISDRGQAIINVLSVRTYDDFAKEFVSLKTSQRCVGADEMDDQDGRRGSLFK